MCSLLVLFHGTCVPSWFCSMVHVFPPGSVPWCMCSLLVVFHGVVSPGSTPRCMCSLLVLLYGARVLSWFCSTVHVFPPGSVPRCMCSLLVLFHCACVPSWFCSTVHVFYSFNAPPFMCYDVNIPLCVLHCVFSEAHGFCCLCSFTHVLLFLCRYL